MPINYSDGETVEKEIYRFLKGQKQLSSDIDLWDSRYDIWPIHYHLSSQRANLIRHFNFESLRVLELGAGMGGLSRYLAESCEFLQVVEGTQIRYDALSERLRDLSNWSGAVANIQDFNSQEKFDVVCLFGVLEYSEKYITPQGQLSPFDVLFQVAKKHLKPGGALIVAIENKLGLKYWNGAAEDHTGRMFDSITGYGPNPGPKTFNRQQLLTLFQNNSFKQIDEFYPFPDYKIPTTLFHSSAFELPAEVIAELATTGEFQSYGNIRQPFYPDYLAMLEVARAGMMPNMANSFLYVGFRDKDEKIRKVLLKKVLSANQKVWHYSKRSTGNVVTTFNQYNSDWMIEKTVLFPEKNDSISHWHTVNDKLINGISLRETIERAAYHHQWKIIENELSSFLQWLIDEKAYKTADDILVDAVWQNARKMDDGYVLFDQEWKIPLSDNRYEGIECWIVFRNIITLDQVNHYWSKTRPWNTLKELYEQITKKLNLPVNYKSHLQNEAMFQSDISLHGRTNDIQAGLNVVMTRKKWRQAFITNTGDWTTLTRYCPIYLPKLRILQRLEQKLRKLREL